MIPAPTSENELLERATALAGFTLGELAEQYGLVCPADLRREKGWVGMLLETCLGATAGSKPEQDFQDLGIELKSIPISHIGKPLETTFVCVAPLTNVHGLTWESSHIRNKLSKVLWIPVEGEREIPVCERHVGMPLIWQPSEEEEAQLKADWEELMEFIVLGKVHQITAKHGEYLQLRPKAANSKVVTEAYGANGQPIKTLPRGFYLRKQFTSRILAAHFMLPEDDAF
ncbi:DNA mismatch repair endonuclease MutH [Enterovibrio norvegicus]|uniref:DNA mismatch repair protein MutH n=1 Tax=Enterovibrio norvegicus TaxID=188144 RepID=A0A2N7LAT1_9GAMM|nr:DNA mismatch repair endonuclease MutH [Enterovibrio norvegicus]PML79391.1 DNA mismatch repair endonuclease MutH [Enterovibrio norvegicus]PMN69465.1 DNA mismatch repair endonuclease MutH [Enterovibrio norvegicus]PMN92118.1 DNA mismatch repair endonuclease MutH [Enterovibrio norvegicus]